MPHPRHTNTLKMTMLVPPQRRTEVHGDWTQSSLSDTAAPPGLCVQWYTIKEPINYSQCTGLATDLIMLWKTLANIQR
eukprot:scaffold214057_cov26-Prasinocladus_malaysianus.AAC.1